MIFAATIETPMSSSADKPLEFLTPESLAALRQESTEQVKSDDHEVPRVTRSLIESVRKEIEVRTKDIAILLGLYRKNIHLCPETCAAFRAYTENLEVDKRPVHLTGHDEVIADSNRRIRALKAMAEAIPENTDSISLRELRIRFWKEAQKVVTSYKACVHVFHETVEQISYAPETKGE